ncbi:MAG: DUF4405 domain-containing protein [Bdellovibrionales bacterium]|nr:DUF4405 domain-containing protein [Bdellovibrionales bacterium]
MKKLYANIVVDFSAFVFLLALAVSGGLLYFWIPRGMGRDYSFLGLSRHSWSDLHVWIAGFFLLTLIVHLALHVKWIFAAFHACRK